MTNLAKDNSSSKPHDLQAMMCLYGKGVARGYAIGRAVVLGATALEVAHYRISADAVDSEKNRLTTALKAAQDEMRELASTLPEDAPRELAALLDVHSMLLADPLLAHEALSLIEARHYNAEWALTAQGQILGEQFAAMEDEYLRERGSDVRQVIERVIDAMSGSKSSRSLDKIQKTDESLIVVAPVSYTHLTLPTIYSV